MYPEEELIRLAAYKAALRRDITLHRIQCAGAAARLAQPVEWVERAMAFIRRISPLTQLTAVAAGLLFRRALPRKLRFFSTLLRWGPTVFAAVRGVGSAVAESRNRNDRYGQRGRR